MALHKTSPTITAALELARTGVTALVAATENMFFEAGFRREATMDVLNRRLLGRPVQPGHAKLLLLGDKFVEGSERVHARTSLTDEMRAASILMLAWKARVGPLAMLPRTMGGPRGNDLVTDTVALREELFVGAQEAMQEALGDTLRIFGRIVSEHERAAGHVLDHEERLDVMKAHVAGLVRESERALGCLALTAYRVAYVRDVHTYQHPKVINLRFQAGAIGCSVNDNVAGAQMTPAPTAPSPTRRFRVVV